MSKSESSMVDVVHLTSVHHPNDMRIWKECKCLADAGYRVTWVVPTDQDKFIDGVLLKAVPRRERRRSRMTRTVWDVYREALLQNARVYHFHDPELIPACLMLRRKQKKVIWDVHENVTNQIINKDWIPVSLRSQVSRGYDRLERQLANSWSAIVTANEDINLRFHRSTCPVVAIHNYSELEEFPITLETARYSSGMLIDGGGINPRSSFHCIVDALGLLTSKVNAHLVVAGSCDSAEYMADLKQKEGWKRIEYRGRVSRHELIAAMKMAAAAIVLYSREGNHLSVRSNRFFEAMAAGLPVIVPDFPEWKMLLKEIGCGLTVDPSSPQDIAGAIRYLTNRPLEVAAMGRHGREVVMARFNWAGEKARLLQLYQHLIGPPGLSTH